MIAARHQRRIAKKQRARLERQADAMLRGLRGFPVGGEGDLVFAADGEKPIVVPLERRSAFLAGLGLEAYEQEIAAELQSRARKPGGFLVTVLIAIEGWAQVAFQDAYPLAKGGAA